MKWPAPAVLLLPLGLCACQDTQARQQNAALTEQVTQLQSRVTGLEARLQKLEAAQPHAPSVAEAGNVTTRAAAQNCAVELARTLESFRQASLEHHYPTRQELELPDACSDQRVAWQTLSATQYAFTVNSASGQVLAQQSGP